MVCGFLLFEDGELLDKFKQADKSKKIIVNKMDVGWKFW